MVALSAGQRGILVRSIYSAEGRVAFDEVSRRYRTDAELYNTVNRYLADFERILREAEQKDASGRLALNHLVSNTGRVYLFLGARQRPARLSRTARSVAPMPP